MNGYYHYPQQGYSYGPQCPYRHTCPMRTECPYCPHQTEEAGGMEQPHYGNMSQGYYGGMNPGFCGNMNMEMGYYEENEEMYPYSEISPEGYGYDNLYPMADNKFGNIMPETTDKKPVIPLYNQYGYINPAENVNSPWDNNKMYENMNNPLPIPNCPYK